MRDVILEEIQEKNDEDNLIAFQNWIKDNYKQIAQERKNIVDIDDIVDFDCDWFYAAWNAGIKSKG